MAGMAGGFFSGYAGTALKLQRLQQTKDEDDQRLEVQKQHLALQRDILKGQEASRKWQDMVHIQTLQKGLEEYGRELEARKLLDPTAGGTATLPGQILQQGLEEYGRQEKDKDVARRALGGTPTPAEAGEITQTPLAPSAVSALTPDTMAGTPGVTPQVGLYQRIVEQQGQNLGLHPDVVRTFQAMLPVENASGDATATSPKGALGPAQLMPATAARYQVDPLNPVQNLSGGLRYFNDLWQMFPGHPEYAIAAFNAGEGAVQKAGGIPNFPETQAYVKKVQATLQAQAPAASNGSSPDGLNGAPSTTSATTGSAPTSPAQQSPLVRQPSTVAPSPQRDALNAELADVDERARRLDAVMSQRPELGKTTSFLEGEKQLTRLRQRRTEIETQLRELTKEQAPKFETDFAQYVEAEAHQRPEVLFATPEGQQQLQGLRQQYEANTTALAGAKKAAELTAEQRVKHANVQAGMREVDDLLSGRTAPGTLSVDQAALAVLRARGLTLKDYPELEQRVQAHAPLPLAERSTFVDPQTMTTPTMRTQAEADQRGVVQLPKEDAASVRQGNVLYAKLQRAQETLQRLVETDPRFAPLRDVSGLTDRAREGLIVAAIRATQDNPLVKQLQSDLQEMGISYARFVSGLGSRPAASLLDRTTKDLPTLDTALFTVQGGGNWLETALRTALSTKLPDLPRSITGQLEMMKDVVRSVQEASLESAGALTPEESASRRSGRMERISQLTQPPQPAPGDGRAGPMPAPGQDLPSMVRGLEPDKILGLGDDVLDQLQLKGAEDLPGLDPQQTQALRLRLYRFRQGL